MCGIFGMIGPRTPEAIAGLTKGTRALLHRGPDDEGIEILPLPGKAGYCAGLGVRRLSIQDLTPAGHMPMKDASTGNWIIFNGEIYNFHVIRAELEGLGHRFRSHGDTEVLLEAYGEWGEACLDRLAGMFAFAIWDAGKNTLVLARDRLGVKPLYYHHSPDLFLFGSEVRSLLASGLVPRRLSGEGLASYLAFGAVQDPFTIVEGVWSLPPGHTLRWENDRLEIRQYWSLPEVAARAPQTQGLGEAVAAVRGLVRQSVSQRLISDVPLGAFLSGGIDSSSIVAVAAEASSRPVETFSVVFQENELSEARYSDLVARQFGSHHHKIELTETDLLEQISGALDAMDQPTVDGINTYVVSRATKAAGVTVALSGQGGDELFAGYPSYRSVPRMMEFQRYAGWVASMGKGVNSLFCRNRTNRLSKALALAGQCYYGDHPYFLSRALFLPGAVCALLGHQPNSCCELMMPWGHAELSEMVRNLDPVNQVAVLEASTYMANMLLRDMDCMGMAVALEVRNPFLDHRLWEYVLPLAGKLKLDSRLPKPLLLLAAGERLPEDVYLRRKMGFTLPFAHWMRNGLKSILDQQLLETDQESQVNPLQVAAVWRAFLAGKTTWSRPWSLFVLKEWIRRHISNCPWPTPTLEPGEPHVEYLPQSPQSQ
jgi:asparagine synthase (glutamine-hydrolysing)